MAYPATTPANPSVDAMGLPAITGWDKRVIYEEGVPADADEQKSCNPKYALLRPSAAAVVDAASDLGVYDPELSLYWFKAAQATLLLLQHCAYKNVSYYLANSWPGITCINFGTRWTVYGDISGDTVTLTNVVSGYANPRDLTALTQIKPAWDTESGETESTNVGLSVTPARFEVRLDGNGYLGRAKVRKIVSSDATTTVLKLTNPLPDATGAAMTLWAEVGDPMVTQDFHLERRLWTKPLDTGWVAVASLPVDYSQELTADGGGHGKIAVPYSGSAELLTVWAGKGGESEDEDITDYFTATIATAGSKILVEEAAGVWTSTIILDKHLTDANITHYKVYYHGQADPADAASDGTVKPRTLFSCAYCKRDWSDSLANCNTAAALDSANGHWYCSKLAEATVDTSAFNSECENLACPQYSTMSRSRGWRYSAANHAQLMFAKNVFTYKPLPSLDYSLIGRGGGKFPSLTWLMGQRDGQYSGYGVEQQERGFGDHGLFGQLVTTEEGDDDYPYKRFVPGAVKAATDDPDGLLWGSGATVCGDPLGSSADDGTQFAAWVKQFRGLRISGQHDLDNFSAPTPLPEPVQRMINRQVVLRGINISESAIGIEQKFYGGHTAILGSNDDLTIRIARERTRTRDIPTDATYIVSDSLSGDLLTLDFSPGREKALYVATGEDVEMEYLTSGLTVDCMEWQKSNNLSSSYALSGYGHANKLQKGDCIRITNAPSPFNNIWLLVLAVESRSGSNYTGTIGGVAASTVPLGTGHPADYEDFRVKTDRAWVWLGGHKGQLVKSAIISLGGISGRTYTIEAKSCAALVPDAEIASKALQARTPTLNIWHRERTATLTGSAAVEITEYSKDAANSEIVISVADWDAGKQNDVCIRGQFLDMRNLLPAEMITGLREAIQECKTFEAGYNAAGFSAILKDGRGEMLLSANYTQSPNWEWDSIADFTPVDNELHWVVSETPLTGYEAGAVCYDGTVAAIVEGTHTAAVTGFSALNYLKADWIEEAWMDVSINNPVLTETTKDIVEGGAMVTDQYTLAATLADLSIQAVIMTFEDGEITASTPAGVSPQFDLIEIAGTPTTWKKTVDVTAILKTLMTNPLASNQLYGIVVSGSNTAADNVMDYLAHWVLECTGKMDGAGTTLYNYHVKYRQLTYDGISFSGLKIKLDMAEIENDGLECPPEFFPALD